MLGILLAVFAAAQAPPPPPPKGPPCYGNSYGRNDIIRLKGDAALTKKIAQCGVAFLLDSSTESQFRSAGVPDAVISSLPRVREPAVQPDDPSHSNPPKPAPPELQRPVPAGPPTGTVRRNTRDGLEYVWINPGTFTMGCSDRDTDCDPDEKPRTEVQLTDGFWIGKTEVTQAAYVKITRGKNPSHFKGPSNPVDQVAWTEARSYCASSGMRLPWEREWEFAARAGTRDKYLGRQLESIAWHDRGGDGTHPVGQKAPNSWGLHDMLGNAWEWVEDTYANYPGGSVSGPKGPTGRGSTVVRGGGFNYAPRYLRVSVRYKSSVALYNYATIGFRCAGTTLP